VLAPRTHSGLQHGRRRYIDSEGRTEDRRPLSVEYGFGGPVRGEWQTIHVFDLAHSRVAVPFRRELVTSSGAGLQGPRGKEQQAQFCAVLKDYIQARTKVSAEANPIRRAEMHPPDPWSFEDSIARVFGPNGEFVDWTGHLSFSVTGSDVVLTFQPTCGSGFCA
jgi:hypothetical protein